jgi:hypothetical protein
MRKLSFTSLAAGIAVFALSVPGASAGGWGCGSCNSGFGYSAFSYGYAYPSAQILYAQPVYTYAQPTYVVRQNYYLPSYPRILDPADARPPLYVVNQGPSFHGPGITTLARRTYSEGGYAYGNDYPYMGDDSYGYGPGYGAGAYSYGYGAPGLYGRPSFRSYGPRYRSSYGFRPQWSSPRLYRPYSSYGYRPSPRAGIYNVPGRRWMGPRMAAGPRFSGPGMSGPRSWSPRFGAQRRWR